jgi:hypothetical protein
MMNSRPDTGLRKDRSRRAVRFGDVGGMRGWRSTGSFWPDMHRSLVVHLVQIIPSVMV